MYKKFNKKIVEKLFFAYFAIFPMAVVVIDLFFSTFSPDSGYGNRTKNFDYSIINQIAYLSVWNALFTSIYGILNWMHSDWKNMPLWVSGKNNATLLTTYNFLVGLGYCSILIYMTVSNHYGHVIGYDSWYKSLKNVVEHMSTPILMLVYYFLFKREIIMTKKYVKKYSWWNWGIVLSYFSFLFLRAAMLLNLYPSNQYELIIDTNGREAMQKLEPFSPYPYSILDPNDVGWGFVIFLVILAIFLFWSVGILFNHLSNIRSDKNYRKK